MRPNSERHQMSLLQVSKKNLLYKENVVTTQIEKTRRTCPLKKLKDIYTTEKTCNLAQ